MRYDLSKSFINQYQIHRFLIIRIRKAFALSWKVNFQRE
jgi:hypothetical protein